MYDIKELEEEWHLYNKRRKRPLYILVFLILLVTVIVLLYVNDKINFKLDRFDFSGLVSSGNENENVIDQKAVSETKVINSEVPTVIDKPKLLSQSDTKDNTIIVQDTPKLIIHTEPKAYDLAKAEPVLEVSDSLRATNQIDVIEKKSEELSGKKIHLDILETSSVTAYKDVERRFYQTHDPDDSLFLAKSYFNRGEYKKAEYWALQTNKVDNNIEESWLIFAQSREKLGYKQDAIKVLRSYIKRSNSLEAKRLLENIK